MYVNVWLDGNGEKGWSLAGLDYPSGGAVSKALPLEYAVEMNRLIDLEFEGSIG